MRGWRPIPAALLSHSVLLCSGTEDISLPTQRLQTSWSRPTQGKYFPDKHRSIGNKTRPVKSFATFAKIHLWKSLTWHYSCLSGSASKASPYPAPRIPSPVRILIRRPNLPKGQRMLLIVKMLALASYSAYFISAGATADFQGFSATCLDMATRPPTTT